MKTSSALITVPLSRLIPSRRNPRRTKPRRESHQTLVALIRAHGLLQPLVIRPLAEKPKHYEVVAGHRRLKALQEIHRGQVDPKIACMVRDVDMETAAAMSLGENFGQEPMHPLDEAEAFAALAVQDGKHAEMIAAEFGVTDRYVRQRMKLADLAPLVKKGYREGEISTATAEVFASVPADRQNEIWKEIDGHPKHPDHVWNIIAHTWIEAKHALFKLDSLPESSVSSDLFSERVLIERQTFLTAQLDALSREREKLIEEGWSQVVVGRYEDIHDQPIAMDQSPREFDEESTRKLERIAKRRTALETDLERIPEDDEKAFSRIQSKIDALEAEEEELEQSAPVLFSEATKAIGTAFLMLYPDGSVRREFRVPRQRRGSTTAGNAEEGTLAGTNGEPPTSEVLHDNQLATTFTHEALVVREALLKAPVARKRFLALVLHEKVRSEAHALTHDANAVTLHAASEGFVSSAFERLKQTRSKFDPLADGHFLEDVQAYLSFEKLSPAKLDALTDHLIVDCLTAHLGRRTELVHHLANELKVNVRTDWKPDARWLSSFQKFQLAHLITELLGPAHAPAPTRKKSELIQLLEVLFAQAAEGTLEDKQLADRLNAWLPANLRPPKDNAAAEVEPVEAN